VVQCRIISELQCSNVRQEGCERGGILSAPRRHLHPVEQLGLRHHCFLMNTSSVEN